MQLDNTHLSVSTRRLLAELRWPCFDFTRLPYRPCSPHPAVSCPRAPHTQPRHTRRLVSARARCSRGGDSCGATRGEGLATTPCSGHHQDGRGWNRASKGSTPPYTRCKTLKAFFQSGTYSSGLLGLSSSSSPMRPVSFSMRAVAASTLCSLVAVPIFCSNAVSQGDREV